LLECALVQCTHAVLTVPTSEMDPEGQATVESLARFQQAKSITAAGSLVRYALSRESVTVLQEATGGLYGWQHPALPDNLCLYRGGRAAPGWVSSAGGPYRVSRGFPLREAADRPDRTRAHRLCSRTRARVTRSSRYMERRFESNVALLTEQLSDYARIVIRRRP